MILKNTKLYYILTGCQALGLGIIIPAYVVYFRQSEISLYQIAILAAIFEATIILCELPTGVFADRFGRKLSSMLGFGFFTLSALVFYSFRSFEGFIVAEILFGIGESFISGALDALAVDSIRSKYSSDREKTLFSNKARIKSMGLLVGMLSGGYIAGAYIGSLFLPIAVIFGSGFLISFLLKEIKLYDKTQNSPDQKNNGSIQQMIFASGLGPLFAVGLMANFAFEGPDQFWQVQLTEIMNVNELYFGILTSAGLLLVALIARFTEKYYDKPIPYLTLSFIAVAAGIYAVGIAHPVWAFVGLVAMFAIKELIQPVILYNINTRIDSPKRATILSGYNLTCSIGEVVAALLAGAMVHQIGLDGIFYFAAIVALLIPGMYRVFRKLELRAK